MTEKVVEIIADDLGNVTIAVRPPFPAAPESFSFPGAGLKVAIHLEDGRTVQLDATGESGPTLRAAEQILVTEFGPAGPPVRETDVMRKTTSDFLA